MTWQFKRDKSELSITADKYVDRRVHGSDYLVSWKVIEKELYTSQLVYCGCNWECILIYGLKERIKMSEKYVVSSELDELKIPHATLTHSKNQVKFC